MDIKILSPLATQHRAFAAGEVVHWPDKADAERMIQRGVAAPARPEKPAGAKENR